MRKTAAPRPGPAPGAPPGAAGLEARGAALRTAAVPLGQAAGTATRPGAGLAPERQDLENRATALSLPEAELSESMRAYFAKCDERIGFVPNVLRAYAHDNAKLEAFAAFYNHLMLAPSGLSKLEREMIAVAVSSLNRCHSRLTAHGAAGVGPCG